MHNCFHTLVCLLIFSTSLLAATPDEQTDFAGLWTHVGPTSASIYWRLGSIENAANSYVEYGETTAYGQQTEATTNPRWAQFHQVKGLKRDSVYHYRLVVVKDGAKKHSKDMTFTTKSIADAISIPGDLKETPYVINKPGHYVVTEDIVAADTAIIIEPMIDVFLDLDGHTVTFGTSANRTAKEYPYGIQLPGSSKEEKPGKVTVRNGTVIQGGATANYTACVGARWTNVEADVAGLRILASGPNAFPIKFKGAAGAKTLLHHNLLHSTVKEIENRHFPGNAIISIPAKADGIRVYDNILTEGCHRGIDVSGDKPIDISYNDIQHTMLFTNGYAIAIGAKGADVHHNRITSLGRAVHIAQADILFHDNWIDHAGTLEKTRRGSKGKWNKIHIEVHGVKIEGGHVKNCKIYNNFVRQNQYLPSDAVERYSPPTPMNIGCGPNAMNEIYGNTFVALTHVQKTNGNGKIGSYGKAGDWAASLIFVSMKSKDKAEAGKYVAYIHDNTFITNHIFIASRYNTENTISSDDEGAAVFRVRIEKNHFKMVDTPVKANGQKAFLEISEQLMTQIQEGGNTSEGMSLSGPTIEDRIKEAQGKVNQQRNILKRYEAALEKLKQEQALEAEKEAKTD